MKPKISKLLSHQKPILLPNQNNVSLQKKNDVQKFIELVDLTPAEKEFYNTELSKPSLKKTSNILGEKNSHTKS